MTESMTLIGRERTVDRSERSRPTGPCEMCGRKRAACRIHEYSDRFVLFGRSLKTFNRGVNHLCRYCADEPSLEMIELPEIADRYQSWVSDTPPDFRSVKFRGADWETCEYLIEYVRASADSPPNGVDADAVRQILSSDGLLLTVPDHTALQWWVVKALKDASTEQERSRCYDLLWRVDDSTSPDTMDVLREKA